MSIEPFIFAASS
uniref:Uncharacterized protein n=1 Tax=Arundo donax TaxID=35708 RepID=A0A0A8XZV0_ARUDO